MTKNGLSTDIVTTIPALVIPGLIVLGVILGLVFVLLHIELLKTRLKIKTAKLQQQEQHIKLLATNMSDWIWTLDANQCFVYVSPSVKKLLGYNAEDLSGQSLAGLFHPVDIERAYALISHALVLAKRTAIENEQAVENYHDTTIDLAFRHHRGHIVWTETAVRIFVDTLGEFTGAQATSRDITERKTTEVKLRQLAFNDPLTQLPNRRLLNDRIRQAQAGCSRHKQYCALFFIDLDNFKYINDNYGHDNGDVLLQQVAQRLFANGRASDTVARFGGDEFVVVSEFLHLEYDDAYEQALLIGLKLIELFENDFSLRDINCRIGASIGVYMFNSDDKALDYMVKQADTAMYQAKARGRNRVVFSGEPLMLETLS